MTTLKKAALLCLSLMTTLAITAGCNTGNTSSSNTSTESSSVNENSNTSSIEDSSSDILSGPDTPAPDENSSSSDSSSDENSSSSETPPVDEDPYKDVVIPPIENTLTDDCTVGEWQLIKPAKCEDTGAMVRYCADDDTHKEVVEIPAKGHNYANNGLCACGKTPTLPDLPDSGYVNITKAESGIALSQSSAIGNEMFNRYVLTTDALYTAETVTWTYEDPETFTMITEYACWIQFSIPEPGQYALISNSNPSNLTIARYDASAHYVNPKAWEGRIMEDGNFISTVSVSQKYFNEQWLTACCIRGTAPGQTVDFTIVRIDEPAWEATPIYEQITAKDIDGVVAPEGVVGTKPSEVPYETDGIYFDATKGYYCMPDGSPIFVAITKKAARQFGGGNTAFSDLLNAGSERNFIIHTSTLPNGNPLVKVYTTMILANPYGEGYNENSYEAQVNSDGLYPVTKELYEFLKLHANHAHPATAPSAEYADNAWLAACYYYKAMELGSQEYPLEITEAGTYTLQQYDAFSDFYFTVNLNAGALSTYKISINTYNVRLYVGTVYYTNNATTLNIQNICFESSAVNSILFHVYDTTFAQNQIEVVIEEVVGSYTNPIAIEANGETVSMQPIKITTADAATKYEVYYLYTITQSGKLTLTSDSTATIMLGGAELSEGTATIDVVYDAETPKNNVIMICVTSTNTEAVNATLTFTPAV